MASLAVAVAFLPDIPPLIAAVSRRSRRVGHALHRRHEFRNPSPISTLIEWVTPLAAVAVLTVVSLGLWYAGGSAGVIVGLSVLGTVSMAYALSSFEIPAVRVIGSFGDGAPSAGVRISPVLAATSIGSRSLLPPFGKGGSRTLTVIAGWVTTLLLVGTISLLMFALWAITGTPAGFLLALTGTAVLAVLYGRPS